MKRSELNRIMRGAVEFIASFKFALPPFVTWSMDEWKTKNSEYDEIKDNSWAGTSPTSAWGTSTSAAYS